MVEPITEYELNRCIGRAVIKLEGFEDFYGNVQNWIKSYEMGFITAREAFGKCLIEIDKFGNEAFRLIPEEVKPIASEILYEVMAVLFRFPSLELKDFKRNHNHE